MEIQGQNKKINFLTDKVSKLEKETKAKASAKKYSSSTKDKMKKESDNETEESENEDFEKEYGKETFTPLVQRKETPKKKQVQKRKSQRK